MDVQMDDLNAQAGPSNSNSLNQPSSSTTQTVFLPPPALPSRLAPFNSSQDLLGRFLLHPAYDKYVLPHVTPVDQWSTQPSSPSSLDKGKGKEKEKEADSEDIQMVGQSPTDGPREEEKEKKKRKKEGSYKHLIKNIVGKHSMKKDDYLTTMLQVPSKQKMKIQKFDARTQRDAFFVTLEGLKGYNAHALIQESDQAREDRKRRKEAKKAERARALALASGAGGVPTPGITSSTPAAAPTPNIPFTAPTPALTPGQHGAPTPTPGNHTHPPLHQSSHPHQQPPSQQQQQRPTIERIYSRQNGGSSGAGTKRPASTSANGAPGPRGVKREREGPPTPIARPASGMGGGAPANKMAHPPNAKKRRVELPGTGTALPHQQQQQRSAQFV